MKHAGPTALNELKDLILHIRRRDGLVERKVGIFYRKSKSFLHFHEDPAGVFADLRIEGEFRRFPVNTAEEREAILAAIDRELSPM